MSFDCQVCVWFLLKAGNIIAVTGTGYDYNYIQLHSITLVKLPSPQSIVSGWRLVVLEIPLHRKFEFLLSVPLILECEAVLTRPQHLATCGLSGAETGRAIVTFNQGDFAAGTKALIAP